MRGQVFLGSEGVFPHSQARAVVDGKAYLSQCHVVLVHPVIFNINKSHLRWWV